VDCDGVGNLRVDGIEAEDPDVLEEFLFVLRPYVFAAGQVSLGLFPGGLLGRLYRRCDTH